MECLLSPPRYVEPAVEVTATEEDRLPHSAFRGELS
jgi:hypothetical protein